MKNIIAELMKNSNIWDISARISHFVLHMGNQIDLWYINHAFKKDARYDEMCRDACYMINAIGTDIVEYLKDHETSESMIRIFYKVIFICDMNMRSIIKKLESDDCIEGEQSEFIELPEINEDSIREKIIKILNDASLYGTRGDTMNAINEELNQANFIYELIDKYKNGNKDQ